jgi:hypothetical protein
MRLPLDASVAPKKAAMILRAVSPTAHDKELRGHSDPGIGSLVEAVLDVELREFLDADGSLECAARGARVTYQSSSSILRRYR